MTFKNNWQWAQVCKKVLYKKVRSQKVISWRKLIWTWLPVWPKVPGQELRRAWKQFRIRWWSWRASSLRNMYGWTWELESSFWDRLQEPNPKIGRWLLWWAPRYSAKESSWELTQWEKVQKDQSSKSNRGSQPKRLIILSSNQSLQLSNVTQQTFCPSNLREFQEIALQWRTELATTASLSGNLQKMLFQSNFQKFWLQLGPGRCQARGVCNRTRSELAIDSHWAKWVDSPEATPFQEGLQQARELLSTLWQKRKILRALKGTLWNLELDPRAAHP